MTGPKNRPVETPARPQQPNPVPSTEPVTTPNSDRNIPVENIPPQRTGPDPLETNTPPRETVI
jgi:hypothetical protein